MVSFLASPGSGVRDRAGALRRRRLPRPVRRQRQAMSPRGDPRWRRRRRCSRCRSRCASDRWRSGEREYAGCPRWRSNNDLVGSAYCLTRNAPVAACVERLVAPVVTGREANPEARFDDAFRDSHDRGAPAWSRWRSALSTSRSGSQRHRLPAYPLWRSAGETSVSRSPAAPVMMVAAYPLAERSPESLAADVIRYGEGRVHAAQGHTLPGSPWRAPPARGAAACARPVDGGYGWRSSDEALEELTHSGAGRHSPCLRPRWCPRICAGMRRAIRRLGPHPVAVGDKVAPASQPSGPSSTRRALDVLRLDVLALGGWDAGAARGGSRFFFQVCRYRSASAHRSASISRGRRRSLHGRDVRPLYAGRRPARSLASPRPGRRPVRRTEGPSHTGHSRARLRSTGAALPLSWTANSECSSAQLGAAVILPVAVRGSWSTNSMARGTS